jgi:serine/threonine protein kinase
VLRFIATLQYSDPQYLNNVKGYTRDKKSDVYSIGMLFWELSSGKTPFRSESTALDLVLSIINDGKREKIIEGTPLKYIDIYTGKYFF